MNQVMFITPPGHIDSKSFSCDFFHLLNCFSFIPDLDHVYLKACLMLPFLSILFLRLYSQLNSDGNQFHHLHFPSPLKLLHRVYYHSTEEMFLHETMYTETTVRRRDTMQYSEVIKSALAYIEQTQTDITAEELAQMAAVNCHCHRLFSVVTGRPLRFTSLRDALTMLCRNR